MENPEISVVYNQDENCDDFREVIKRIDGFINKYRDKINNSNNDKEKALFKDILNYCKKISNKFNLYHSLYLKTSTPDSKNFVTFVLKSISRDVDSFVDNIDKKVDKLSKYYMEIDIINQKIREYEKNAGSTLSNILSFGYQQSKITKDLLRMEKIKSENYENILRLINEISEEKYFFDMSEENMASTMNEYAAKFIEHNQQLKLIEK